jgi:ketosteroid isomerase-like protein
MGKNFKTIAVLFFVAVTTIVFNSSWITMHKDAPYEKIIKDYYGAYEKKDWNLMEPLLADGFTFTSPNNDDHIDIKRFKEKCWPGAYKIKKFDVAKIIGSGDEAYATYTCTTVDGKFFRNTEYYKFKDGKIAEIEVFFGTGINFPK